MAGKTAMRYRLEIKEEARQQLRALAKEQRRNVGRRLDAPQSNLSGDVKKLTAKTHELSVASRQFASAFHTEKRSDQRCMLCGIESKPMSNVASPKKPTLKSLAAEMRRLQERIEDMEDLMELRSAIERNAGKPGVPSEQVKTELDLD